MGTLRTLKVRYPYGSIFVVGFKFNVTILVNILGKQTQENPDFLDELAQNDEKSQNSLITSRYL